MSRWMVEQFNPLFSRLARGELRRTRLSALRPHTTPISHGNSLAKYGGAWIIAGIAGIASPAPSSRLVDSLRENTTPSFDRRRFGI